MTQHTPGPWRHVSIDGGWDGIEAVPSKASGLNKGQLLAKLSYNNPANAFLMAKAPEQQAKIDKLEAINAELLVALEAALEWHKGDKWRETRPKAWKFHKDRMLQSIAKAKGEL